MPSYFLPPRAVLALLSVLSNALALFMIAYFLPYDAAADTGVISSGTPTLYVVAGLLLGLLNVFVKPILKLVSFPFIIASLGLFLVVINAIILALLSILLRSLAIPGVEFEIRGAVTYVLAVAILAAVNILSSLLFK